MTYVKTIDEYINDASKTTATQRKNAIDAADKMTKSKIDLTNNVYDKSLEDAKVAYEGEYQRNAVQKAINEKIIAEKNANLGLTDSGLNRMQQTAVQLSYSNQKANIDLQRQNAINTLETNLASAIAAINQENESNKLAINQSYDQMNLQTATDLRNTDIAQKQYEEQLKKQLEEQLEERLEEQKRQFDETIELQREQTKESAAQVIESNSNKKEETSNLLTYGGIDEKTGKSIFYDKDGKNRLVERGVNPYTGTIHQHAKYGTFNNGYQPNNVGKCIINGKEVVNTLTRTGSEINLNGRWISIWKDKNGNIWYWDGLNNCYQDATEKN